MRIISYIVLERINKHKHPANSETYYQTDTISDTIQRFL